MAANSNLTLTSLDFDTLKSNLINYLSSQPEFKDYNFSGSNLNVLLDILSYNSYLNSFYLNMIASEMFLDSAQKLDSVISHAKELNYTPRSGRSAEATISFNIDTVGIEKPLIIPKGTLFSGLNSNGGFTFVTDRETTYLSSNTYVLDNKLHTVYSVANLAIYEGSYVQDVFVMDYTQPNQIFTLSNPSIDTNSITVTVTENSVNSEYFYAKTLYNLNSNSEVYFLQATANQQYQVLFGDNVFGYKPLNGDIIYVKYRTTSGSDGNGVTSFNIDQDLGAINGGVVVYGSVNVNSSSVGGANSEGIESIRFNAPRFYQTQDRCITTNDYISTIIQNFPEVKYVNVFSSNIVNNAVVYGTVFISPSTYSGTVLTDSRKTDIQTFVNNLSPIGINVKIIDPDYLYVTINSTIHVDYANTTSTSAGIITNAAIAIQKYNDNNLKNFNTALRMSKLENEINNSDRGILSNETTSKIYKIFSPPLNVFYALNCKLGNKIQSGSVLSSTFISNGVQNVLTDYIENVDTGSGIIYLYQYNSTYANTNPIYTKIGTVDYATGTININQIEYNNIFGGIKIYATPSNQDIYCSDNTIIEIDTMSGLSLNTVSG